VIITKNNQKQLLKAPMFSVVVFSNCLVIKTDNYRLDWIEQGLTSPPTQYRLSGRQFYRSKDPTNSIKELKEKLASTDRKRLKTHQGPPTVLQVNL